MIKLDVNELLRQAPIAVESYYPGHWERMCELERRAQRIVAQRDLEAFVKCLCDVAFLKQPREDHANLPAAIERSLQEVRAAMDALGDIGRLDYQTMELLARVPGFGRGGGRAFNSAVVRLVCPKAFGIIDWRNLAVLMAANGFEGLVDPPLKLDQLSADEVLRRKGNLVLTQQVYERYNNELRAIARAREGRSRNRLGVLDFLNPEAPVQPFSAATIPHAAVSNQFRRPQTLESGPTCPSSKANCKHLSWRTCGVRRHLYNCDD